MTRSSRRHISAQYRRTAIAATIVALTLGGYIGTVALTPSGTTLETPVIVTATGDLGGSIGEIKPVADLMAAQSPDKILLLGDLVYPDGAPSGYSTFFNAVYGPYRDRIIAAPGNHDFHEPGGAGFFGYFPDLLPHAFDLANGWTVITINTEVSHGAGSPQEIAVKALALDAKARGRHILAITHHPRYTGGSSHGDDTAGDAIVADLDAAGADLFLAGHNHLYERFQPMGTGGSLRPDGQGIRFWTVGTGGNGLYSCTSHVGRQTCDDQHHGALKLALYSDHYDWAFLPTTGGQSDPGTATTRTGGPPPSTSTSTASTSTTTTSSTSSTSTTTSSSTTTTSTTTRPPAGCLPLTLKYGLDQYPFVFRSGTCTTGGVAWGAWDYQTTPWETFHGTSAYSIIAPTFTMTGAAAVNYGDSFQIKPGGDGFVLDGVRGFYGHDDLIENDAGMSGTVRDSFGSSFVVYSDQGEDPADRTANTVTLDGNIFRLDPTPTVYKGPDTTYNKYPAPGTGGFFKLDAMSARLVLHGNLFVASVVPNHQTLDPPPASKLRSCTGNAVIWLGAGEFPGRAAWASRCPDTIIVTAG